MLLAIVLEHYTELVHQVHSDPEMVDLFTQSLQTLKAQRATKGHINLQHLVCELEEVGEHLHV